MAGVLLRANSGEIALTANTAKTVLQIVAAANHRALVRGLRVHGKGIVVTDTPMRVRVLRQADAGTMTAGTDGTHLSKNSDSDDETVQTTVRINATVEPTAGDVLDVWEVHPQTGESRFYPFDQPIVVKGGGRLGIEVLAAQAQTVTVAADVEE